MPKENIDYSNTIIYKIYCKDETITDIYIGHTTNFIQRKYTHRASCKKLNCNLKIYNIIRSNGGWENWDMVEIAKYNCKDATEARIKEQYHYESLKSNLNSVPPYVDKIKYLCSQCNLQCSGPKQYNEHMTSNKHIKKFPNNGVFSDDFTSKNSHKFICKICDFKCCKTGDWNRHILTAKHQKQTLSNDFSDKSDHNYIKNAKKTYVCENCDKKYKSRNGLWWHKKNCVEENLELTPGTQLTPELVIKLIEQNKELQQTLIEQNKTIIELAQKAGSHNTINNNNCGNKTFNLQVFLNETCKDAINMTDFVNQLQVSLSDLETTGRIGYSEGISKVFIKNLNEINYTDRPLHCSDLKRETLYIKDDNKWIKDDEQKSSLTKAIKKVANKNIQQISEWQKLHPDFSNPESKINDKYMKIILNSMSGSTKEESDKNYEKIAKNVIKEVVIDK